MAELNIPLLAFNRGVITKSLQARDDIDKFKWAAEIQTNWIPRIFGSMSVRPGTRYIHSVYNSLYSRSILFTKSIADQQIIEFTDGNFRIIDDEIVLTRPSVSTAITNGTFASNLTGWTDDSDSGGATVWASGGFLQLTGDGDAGFGRIYQLVTVAPGDQNKEHGLRVVVHRNEVVLKVGSTLNGSEYLKETLGHGEHSLSITPAGNFYVQFESPLERATLVSSIIIEAAGTVLVPTPYSESDLDYIRYDQSADVVYLACRGFSQRKIERRSARSWSLVYYEVLDGPFFSENVKQITITPSGLSGNITLTASREIFETGHIGALFQIKSIGQLVEETIIAEDAFTDTIEVKGVEDARKFVVNIKGTFTATVTLQRRSDVSEDWEDIKTYTAPTSDVDNISDGLENQIVFYRIGVKTGDFTSGTVFVSLKYTLGSKTGIVRITGYTSAVSASAEVIVTLGRALPSGQWSEGYWSYFRGFPSAVSLHEGRLHWVGKYYTFSSISDSYESYDQSVEGDSGVIIKNIGSGVGDNVNWSLALNRLIIGAEITEKTLRSNSFDEVLTPSNSNIKDASNVGNNYVYPVKIDQTGIFVNGYSVYEMSYNPQNGDYGSEIINHLCPEIGHPYIVRLGMQRYPEARVHFVRSDGKVAIMLYKPNESIRAFVLYETDGFVEDVLVQRNQIGSEEDIVYYTVRRIINGNTVRYRERWAFESECVGGSVNKNLDSHIVANPSGTAISGLSHLEGKTVKVWGDGKDLGGFTVISGSITLTKENVGTAVVGLPFTALYKSVKLAYAASNGTALLMKKRVNKIGLMLQNTHIRSLKYGQNFTDNNGEMFNLSKVEGGQILDDDYIHIDYDNQMIPFGGGTATDPRICFKVQSLPCTILGMVAQIRTNDL